MGGDIFEKLLQGHVGKDIKFSRNFHLLSVYNDAQVFRARFVRVGCSDRGVGI